MTGRMGEGRKGGKERERDERERGIKSGRLSDASSPVRVVASMLLSRRTCIGRGGAPSLRRRRRAGRERG
eukprot:700498-Pleurochrysis_carterae.AAC.1